MSNEDLNAFMQLLVVRNPYTSTFLRKISINFTEQAYYAKHVSCFVI